MGDWRDDTVLSLTAFGYRGFAFSWGDHVCAIFDDPTQQMEIMLPFVASGLRAEQRCAWISPEAGAASFRKRLAETGADLPTLEASGQLVVISDVDFYLHKGLFEPERTMDLLLALLQEGRDQGYPAMRAATDVSVLTREHVDPEVWEQFESQVTESVAGLPLVKVCQYLRRQLSGDIVIAALRTHPVVILGDVIRENPFYRAPADSVSSADLV